MYLCGCLIKVNFILIVNITEFNEIVEKEIIQILNVILEDMTYNVEENTDGFKSAWQISTYPRWRQFVSDYRYDSEMNKRLHKLLTVSSDVKSLKRLISQAY